MFGVIVNNCSNEICFLDALLKECSTFAEQIVVSYADKLYNGEPEHFPIDDYVQRYPKAQFVQYYVDLSLPDDKKKGVDTRPVAYWHNLARMTAIDALKPEIDWVFVIDMLYVVPHMCFQSAHIFMVR